MRLTLTRDDVAMGDEPRPQDVELPDGATLADLVTWLGTHRVGARVHGGSTWALRVGRAPGSRGTAVAVLTLDPDSLTLAADPDLPLDPDTGLHLEYLLAQDVAATLALVREDPARPNLRLPRLG